MDIIQDFLVARADFRAAITKLQLQGEDTSPYVWNSEVAHMRDFEEAYDAEEREALWAWWYQCGK